MVACKEYIMSPNSNPITGFMQPENARYALAMLDYCSPITWDDHLHISSAHFVLGDTSLALIAAREALRADRNSATLTNLAVILESQGEFHSAFPLIEEAYALDPSSLIACHYSDALLRMGRLSEAWPLYSDSHTQWANVGPKWDGTASLRGKHVLLLAGGGFGDTILHSRWIPRLLDLGARITFVCPDSMRSLFPSTYFTDSGHCDFAISLLDLARYFCPNELHIPHTPYIHADQQKESLRRAVLHAGAAPVFGLCTRAGEEKIPRRNRSLSDEQTERILNTSTHKGADWVNLNYDRILHDTIQPSMRDWSDTAAIIACLDRVVTVDTGVAHLAGALGIPCWLILPGNSAAYYGVWGNRSIFYPSQRLFRNRGEGMDSSLDAVCAALEIE